MILMHNPEAMELFLTKYGKQRLINRLKRELGDLHVCLELYENAMYGFKETKEDPSELDGNVLMLIEFGHIKTLMDLMCYVLAKNDKDAMHVIEKVMHDDEELIMQYLLRSEESE